MVSKRVIAAIVLSTVILMSAGCTGWGDDGPSDPPEEETDGNGEAQEDVDTVDEGGESDESSTTDAEDDSDRNESDTSDEDDSSQDGSEAPDESEEEDTSETDSDDSDESDESDSDESDESDTSSDTDDTDESDDSSDESDSSDDSDESDEQDEDESDENDDESDESDEDDEDESGEEGDEGEEDDDEEVYTLTVESDEPVTLERNWEDASTTREPTDGVVEFSVIEGEYTLSADGYEDMVVEVGEDMTVQMSEDEETHTLTVETQQDVPVTLERFSDGATTERTASDGAVEFTVLEGYYGLSADGHYDIHEEFAVHVDEDTTITLQSTDGERIEVTVVDAESGEPIQGAEISGVCDWWYTSGDAHTVGETNIDGVAQPETITPTSCDGGVSADGYEDKSVSLSVPDDDGRVIELEPEEPTTHTLHVTSLARL
ncbi:hypothetical protein [Halalkalicoccus tibetensis]|uniref:PEGA domain-containing protein n=1 Tax=Halalkalicoccus tibetensis TaxID=175632 RepID=A0ABD5UYE4_9EURY